MPKLGDFGILKDQISSTQTKASTFMGTVPYMSPERLQYKKYGRSSDVWAVGLILYEMLSGGKKAFDDPNAAILLNKIIGGEPDPLPDFVGEGILTFLSRLLAKNLDNRPTI